MHVNWNDVEEKRAGSGIQTLPSGAYKCSITAAKYVTTKKGECALMVVWDVADGEHRGHFADKFFDGKDFRHNDYLMLEGKGLGIAKHKLHVLARVPHRRLQGARHPRRARGAARARRGPRSVRARHRAGGGRYPLLVKASI